ncbi:MAG: chemoreceptor glutamine deamidase CheD [Alphaproteobacteria bacterium]|nr:chemoreceptor glutamine deamidase CheD [Alphaproteobacteria bacterium]NDG04528.1 chemoreceptor glutamine deamidase CheD [Alphaproteobacteria bacterium]
MNNHRRGDSDLHQVGDYYDNHRRYFDHNFEVTVVKIFSGDCYATNNADEMIVTILGSCIAACIRDPLAGVAGMNHFLLPGDPSANPQQACDAARYGAFAMEQLINQLLALGAARHRLEVKLFGGGNVIDSHSMIGSKNIHFVKEFVTREGLHVAASDLGGECPRRIHYFSKDGRVMMRKLQRRDDLRVVETEKAYHATLNTKPLEGSIELFG